MSLALLRRMADETPDTTKPSASPQRTLGILLVLGVLVGAAGMTAAVRFFPSPRPAGDSVPAANAGASSPRRASNAVPVRDAGPSKWTGSTQPGWARNGSRTIAFELAAERDVAVWMKRARPSLAVRCLYGRTEVYVVPGSAAAVESRDRHTVRLAFDDGAEVSEQWEESSDAQELFAPDGVALARQFAHARTLRFGFTPYGAAPAVAEFDLTGFDRLVGIVAKTCGWKP
jgi:hypothetical protein